MKKETLVQVGKNLYSLKLKATVKDAHELNLYLDKYDVRLLKEEEE